MGSYDNKKENEINYELLNELVDALENNEIVTNKEIDNKKAAADIKVLMENNKQIIE